MLGVSNNGKMHTKIEGSRYVLGRRVEERIDDFRIITYSCSDSTA